MTTLVVVQELTLGTILFVNRKDLIVIPKGKFGTHKHVVLFLWKVLIKIYVWNACFRKSKQLNIITNLRNLDENKYENLSCEFTGKLKEVIYCD